MMLILYWGNFKMKYQVGYEVFYKPEGNKKYIITRISQSYGKNYAHLSPVGSSDPKKNLRVALPLSEVYFCFPDNIGDILAEL